MTVDDSPEAACGYDRAAVAALSHQPVPPGTKGFSALPGEPPPTGAGLAAAGATLFDGRFGLPLLAVRDGAVAHNVALLARFADRHGLALAPHAKTTMAPQLFARQLDAGAWGLTAATIDQLVTYRAFGVQRVLLANELTDPRAIAVLAAHLRADPRFEALCYVDSLDGVRLLHEVLAESAAAGSAPARPLEVLVELGFPGGRTGCRTAEQARAVAAAAARTPTLRVVGAAGYEGGLGHDRGADTLSGVAGWCRRLIELVEVLRTDGVLHGPGLLSAGGSAYPDVVADALADRPPGSRAVLRSGSYVVHDDGMYADRSPFTAERGSPEVLRPALTLWASVLSRPEPGLAVLGLGRRDAGFDHGLPVPQWLRTPDGRRRPAHDWTVTGLDDQHAYLAVPPGASVEPGWVVGLGISHPCTTLDRWRHPVLVDDDDHVLDVLTTCF